MIIYIARHGQTDANVNGIIQGHMDVPLNDAGRKESEKLRDHLADVEFVEAWSSSLSRARETAEIVVAPHPGLVLQTAPGLMERDLGSLNGKRWHRGEPLPDDVEPSSAFRTRISEWLAAFLAAHESTPADAKILIISHGAYLTTLLGILLSPPYSLKTAGVSLDEPCHNTCLARMKLDYKDDAKWRGRILSWAEVEHLGGRDSVVRIGVADDLRRAGYKVHKEG